MLIYFSIHHWEPNPKEFLSCSFFALRILSLSSWTLSIALFTPTPMPVPIAAPIRAPIIMKGRTIELRLQLETASTSYQKKQSNKKKCEQEQWKKGLKVKNKSVQKLIPCCWAKESCSEDWICGLKKRVLDETGVISTAFLHKCIPCTNHAQQIIVAFK